MRDVQCYELFGGIALKNHAFSFSLLACSVDYFPLKNICILFTVNAACTFKFVAFQIFELLEL